MNCLEWLPIYFGILKTGAIAVPLNFRYASDEIQYCLDLADVDILVFGPEFIGRVEEIAEEINTLNDKIKDINALISISDDKDYKLEVLKKYGLVDKKGNIVR